MTAIVAAAAGFLIAVLWFDLMFDVQVLRHRGKPLVPDDVLDSIARYYRRVTTTASPMGRLVAVVMLALFAGLIVQAVRGDAPVWVSAVSFPMAILAVGLAMVRVFGAARRLGTRADPPGVQTSLARGICRDHLICLAAMSTLLLVQLVAA
jgi:L-asparagine transporter-like permease